MGFLQAPFGDKPVLGFEPGKAFSAQLGAASPLWFAFMGVAGAGVAFWWMTRWARPLNIEASGAATLEPVAIPIVDKVAAAPEPATQAFVALVEEAVVLSPIEAPVVEAAVVEAEVVAAEPVVEATPIVETAPQPIAAEAAVSAPVAMETPAVEVPPAAPVRSVKAERTPKPKAPVAEPVPNLVPPPEPVLEAPAEATATAEARPTPKKRLPASSARVSARTKRRQPSDQVRPKGPPKRH